MSVRPVHVAAVLMVVGLIVVLFVVSRIAPAPDRSLVRVQQAGELTVGVDPSYPPFEVDNGEGQLVGFDIDLINELARRMGVKARFVSIDFGGIYDALGVAKFDVIVGGISPSTDDDRQFAFTRSYFDDGLVVVAGPPTLGNVLGIESGSDADLALPTLRNKLTEYSFQRFDDQDLIRNAISRQSLRGAIVDRVTASQWSRDLGNLTVSQDNLTSVPYVIEGRRGDSKLLQALDRALQSMLDDGFIATLDGKWLRS